ncbi:uncharacterized protein Z519_09170 [Cladophialophora bantiana CBS 173.52]|uniref:AMP-activated protein kinase glycogen-binding domain-containing protein n=1 Tax=Cladophialophora bantiana (strain ATCC 10958 / CBS 173.52 / CDC B-1940 / NIH 8579) TaxID=1442370 RepID=A0A0D2HBE1_CLAB1|nr:uncharacterized protein Z519_09170 [Cladophialophora bantiana CBS 173.52]KIW90523.1 hypothetical protein Z519_09170 [Cladophialophora bantiana CBS 173.52]
MVSTTIVLEKDNVQPPVYIAGSFTDWSPIEMRFESTAADGSTKNIFSYKIELEPGDYQYKFRLGPGDWWILDESSPTANDEHGNVNNVISVEAQVSGCPSEEISRPAAPILNTKGSPIIEDEPDHPSEDRLPPEHEAIEPYPPAGEVMSNLLDSHHAKDGGVKQVHFDEAAGKLTEDIVATRKDSIPDFAPPPYSIAADGTIPPLAAQATSAVSPEKQPPETVGNSKPGTKTKSFISRICTTRSLVLVVAMVAVPIAVSYYLRR